MNSAQKDSSIRCPKCDTAITLTEALSAPILAETQMRFEKQLQEQERENRRLAGVLAKQERQFTAEFDTRLRTIRREISEEETRRAKLAQEDRIQAQLAQVAELERIISDRDQKLSESRNLQAELKRQERKLQESKDEIELTVETRVNASLKDIREKALLDAEGRLKLKIVEKEQTISSMQGQIEALQRRAEQGSQQLQGEAQEIEIESILRSKFPSDIIEPVPNGASGGDILHRVLGPRGRICGTIIWESKRTRQWSDGWLSKLRGDQRACNADAAILVSEALPKGLHTFDLRNDVWVAEFKSVVPIATAIRQALIQLTAVRKAEEGQQTKMAMTYAYLTGQRFRQRIRAIVEHFSDMQADLDRERRAATRLWAKREIQIRGVIESTAGMYGDLQGIAIGALQEIEGLDHLALLGQDKSRV